MAKETIVREGGKLQLTLKHVIAVCRKAGAVQKDEFLRIMCMIFYSGENM